MLALGVSGSSRSRAALQGRTSQEQRWPRCKQGQWPQWPQCSPEVSEWEQLCSSGWIQQRPQTQQSRVKPRTTYNMSPRSIQEAGLKMRLPAAQVHSLCKKPSLYVRTTGNRTGHAYLPHSSGHVSMSRPKFTCCPWVRGQRVCGWRPQLRLARLITGLLVHSGLWQQLLLPSRCLLSPCKDLASEVYPLWNGLVATCCCGPRPRKSHHRATSGWYRARARTCHELGWKHGHKTDTEDHVKVTKQRQGHGMSKLELDHGTEPGQLGSWHRDVTWGTWSGTGISNPNQVQGPSKKKGYL